MPICTVAIDKKRVIVVYHDSIESLLEARLEDEYTDLNVRLTTWTVRGKPIWDGNIKRLSIRFAKPAEAERYQRAVLAMQHEDPDADLDDAACALFINVDPKSVKAADDKLQLMTASRHYETGKVAPLN